MKIVFSNITSGPTIGVLCTGDLFSNPSVSDRKIFMKCISLPQYAAKDNKSICVDVETGQLHKFDNTSHIITRDFSLVEKNKF